MGSKSVHEAFELQTDFAKSAFEAYIGELTKFSELVTATAKDTFAPLRAASGLGRDRAERPRRLIAHVTYCKGPGSRPGPFCFAAAGLTFA